MENKYQVTYLPTNNDPRYDQLRGTFIAECAEMGITIKSKELPPILHAIRDTCENKPPHGNTIRAKLLDFGKFTFALKTPDNDTVLWKITIKYDEKEEDC